MRDCFSADWAAAIVSTIKAKIEEFSPHLEYKWPLFNGFIFDSYIVNNKYVIQILKDHRQAGVDMTGPGVPTNFPYTDHPELPINDNNFRDWNTYIRTKFNLRNKDFVFIVIANDSKKSQIKVDWSLLNNEEKRLFWSQIDYEIKRFNKILEAQEPNKQPITQNITITGNANVLTIGSQVGSIKSNSNEDLFNKLKELAKELPDTSDRDKILLSIQEMHDHQRESTFTQKYQSFTSLVSDHITIFAPFFPALAALLS